MVTIFLDDIFSSYVVKKDNESDTLGSVGPEIWVKNRENQVDFEGLSFPRCLK